MVADSDPGDFVALEYADGPVAERDANRVNGLALMDFLELQAGVLSVLSEQAVSISSELSRLWR